MPDLPPAVQSVIRRCLWADPSERPTSIQEVLASLPGGDPLAAALSAGETPSPELVASSGKDGRLSFRLATGLFIAVIVGLFVTYAIADKTQVVNKMELLESPAVLSHRAREILDHLGYDSRGMDYASGFRGVAPFDPIPEVMFWYRESPDALVANQFFHTWAYAGSTVDIEVPAWSVPRMKGVMLGSSAELKWFRALPDRKADANRASAIDWLVSFPTEITGIELADLEVAEWQFTPPDAYDDAQSWEGTNEANERVYVQAAGYRGRPTYFEVFGEEEFARGQQYAREKNSIVLYAFLGTLGTVTFCIALLALRHWNTRLGDRRGAFRFSFVVGALGLGEWIVATHHVGDWREFYLFVQGANVAIGTAVLTWLKYMALEPPIRKHWPEQLISWTRIFAGKVTDPRIGCDVLSAVLFQTWMSIYLRIGSFVGLEKVSTDHNFLLGWRGVH